MPSTCALCGKHFQTWEEYKMHTAFRHSQKIMPVNTSGRTKAEIVSNAESTWLRSFIIESNNHDHLEACRCPECFSKYLDKVVKFSDDITKGN
jgi:DNA-directed RNA polymerase subunit RPC12/RpoP